MQTANSMTIRARDATLRVLDGSSRNLGALVVGAIVGFAAAIVVLIGLGFLVSVLAIVAAAPAHLVGGAAWTIWAITMIVSFIAAIIGGAIAVVMGMRELTRSLKAWPWPGIVVAIGSYGLAWGFLILLVYSFAACLGSNTCVLP